MAYVNTGKVRVRIEIEDNRRDEARRAIDAALGHIAKIPLKMTLSRKLEKELLDLRASIGSPR